MCCRAHEQQAGANGGPGSALQMAAAAGGCSYLLREAFLSGLHVWFLPVCEVTVSASTSLGRVVSSAPLKLVTKL